MKTSENTNINNKRKVSRAKFDIFDNFDPFELIGVVLSHIGIVIIAVLISLAIASAQLSTVSPVYNSTAVLRIKPARSIGASMLESGGFGGGSGNQQLIATYLNILKSRSVVEPIIPELFAPDESGAYPGYSESLAESVISTQTIPDTEMVKVTFTGSTPEKAQHGNEVLIKSFMDRLVELDRELAHDTSNFIQNLVTDAKSELEKAENTLSSYQKETKLLSPDDDVRKVASKLATTDQLKADNQLAISSAETRRALAMQQLKDNAQSIADNSVIQKYKEKIAELEFERISYMDKYTPRHPKVISINQEIETLKREMSAEIERVVKLESPAENELHDKLMTDKLQAEIDIALANSNLAAIQEMEDKYNSEIGAMSDNQKQYLRYMRNVTIAEEIYMMLAKRLEEAKVAEVSVTRDVYVIDKPDLQTHPLGPDKSKKMLTALLFGVALSAGFIIMCHMSNRTIRTPDDIEKYLDLPILGQIPSYDAMDKVRKQQNMSAFEKGWKFLWNK